MNPFKYAISDGIVAWNGEHFKFMIESFPKRYAFRGASFHYVKTSYCLGHPPDIFPFHYFLSGYLKFQVFKRRI